MNFKNAVTHPNAFFELLLFFNLNNLNNYIFFPEHYSSTLKHTVDSIFVRVLFAIFLKIKPLAKWQNQSDVGKSCPTREFLM